MTLVAEPHPVATDPTMPSERSGSSSSISFSIRSRIMPIAISRSNGSSAPVM